MQGLNEIMCQHPYDGKYNPHDDDKPDDPPSPPEQCSDDGDQGFFDSLVFGEEYVIMTVLSGIADIFRGATLKIQMNLMSLFCTSGPCMPSR